MTCAPRGSTPRRPNAAIYYGLGVTEHTQGSTMVMGMANLAMATGNIGRPGVGVNPLRGQNNVQGSCDMGSFPHELPGYRHVSDPAVRAIFEAVWGTTIDPEPGLRIPNMFDAAIDGRYLGMFVQGEDIAQTDPNVAHVKAALGSLELLVVQDLFLNETAKFAHVFLPGTSFLEKDGTFTNAERRINRVRPVMAPTCGKQEWQVACELATAMGYPMDYAQASEIMDEIAATTPTFAGVSFERLDAEGTVQWPCNDAAPHGTTIMHVDGFVRGKGHFVDTPFVPTDERTNRKFPLILTTGRILSPVQRRRADPSHPERAVAPRGRRRDPPARRRDARHPHRRLGDDHEQGRRDGAARQGQRPDAAGRRLHDVPLPGVRRERRDDRVLRLGHELPGVQGHRRRARADLARARHRRGDARASTSPWREARAACRRRRRSRARCCVRGSTRPRSPA